MQTSETYMIGGVPASINTAISSCYSHTTQNGVTPEHAGALAGAHQRAVGGCIIATYSDGDVPLACGYPTRCLGVPGCAPDSATARLRCRENGLVPGRAGS